MVTLLQVKNGLVKYVDSDILPHLTGFKKIALGAYVALASENVVSVMSKNKDNPAVAVLDVVDENDNADIDKLYQAFSSMMPDGQKYSIDIPMIGELRVDRSDLEKLYQYIRG